MVLRGRGTSMNIGASIYPDDYSFKKMIEYVDKLHSHGITRIFLSILHLKKSDQEQLNMYKSIIKHMKNKNMTLVADINPAFIEEFGWHDNLSEKITEFGVDIVRFDEVSDIDDLVKLSQNESGLKLEINMSTDAQLIRDLVDNGARLSNITASHNFYPRKFTGLSIEHFMKMTNIFNEYKIETSAFINASSADEGPWEVSEGLCTLEKHRYQSIEAQLMFYKLIGKIDNLIIANQFISDEELTKVFDALNAPITFKMYPTTDLTEVEKEIINFKHTYRGDISEYLIRSSQTRIAFSEEQIDSRFQDKVCKRGDILIDNDKYTRYKGELYIALKSHDVGEKTNIVGRLTDEYCSLLKYLQPWQEFRLKLDN